MARKAKYKVKEIREFDLKEIDKVAMGYRIKERRLELGFTQYELAEYVDVSTQMIGYIEKGEKGMASDTVYKMCQILGFSYEYLMTGEDEPAWLVKRGK